MLKYYYQIYSETDGIMNGKQNKIMLQLPILLGIVMYGGFYDFCVYAVGVITLLFLFIKLGKDKKSKTIKNEIFYGSIVLCASAAVSAFAGVNRGMAWLGVFRVFVMAVWIFYLMQFDKNEREAAVDIIPWAGAVMVLTGIISLMLRDILPQVADMFWQADRFGGTFQYSNTCALFLLTGLLVIAGKVDIHKKELAVFDVLLLGIFLTGSKGGILLLIPVLIWILKSNKAFRVNGLCMVAVLVAGGIVYATISGDFQNIGRIYTLFTNQSTLYGRMLYMKDAIPVLLSNPLGTGYMGYWAMQSSIQTGVYTSMFVHNDWIQMGLDYGWLFLIVSIAVIIKQLIKGQQDRTNRIIMILICGYSLMEFHLQYLSVVMILLLVLDFREKDIMVNKIIVARENQIFAVFGMILLGYFAVQALFSHIGLYEKALGMYSYDTPAKEALLQKENNKDAAVELAKEILVINSYSADSYNVLAYGALMDGHYKKAIDYKYKVVEIKKYNMTEYTDFMEMLDIIRQSDDSEQTKTLCQSGYNKIEQLMKETKDNTSPLAYKLRDKPEFIHLE